jgi:hypothetical protein
MAPTPMDVKADRVVETAKKPAYLLTLGITYVGYVFLFLGVSYVSPGYIRAFGNFMHIMICLFLIYKFNPLRGKIQLTEYDSQMIFLSSMFILVNLGLTELSDTFFNDLKKVFDVDMRTVV